MPTACSVSPLPCTDNSDQLIKECKHLFYPLWSPGIVAFVWSLFHTCSRLNLGTLVVEHFLVFEHIVEYVCNTNYI